MNKDIFAAFCCILFLFANGNLIAQIENSQQVKTTSPLAAGHQQLRSILGDDIGKMKFDTPELIALRSYLYNSLLTSSSNSYSTGSYSESDARILFCPDGSYVQVLSGMISLDVEGASAYSGGTDPSDVMPGIWEVAVAEGVYYILFYSTHPTMLEDSPNGFLPLPIVDYQDDILLLYGDDHYRRQVVYDCGY